MFQSKSYATLYLVMLAILILVGNVTASPDDSIGENPAGNSLNPISRQSISSQSLSRTVSEFGNISLSLDAMGTMSSTGIVQVNKPEGATVRKAYLMSATTGFQQVRLETGDVKLQETSVVWEKEIPSSISSYNYWADVTAIVTPVVNAAAPGLVDLEIAENSSAGIDGEILAVLFDDPNQTNNNNILLYFGAQDVDGDSFVIDFGAPIDKDDPNISLDYSLGISYGYQATIQYSQVDVNGSRLTTSAGGQDDGEPFNGALITVGGIGDSNDNPPDPNAGPDNPRSDDELYDLMPFVKDGDTTIKIDTVNPSDDDNILFAAVSLGTTRGVDTIDLDISLHSNPTTEEARAPYENIINYFADGVFEASNGAHKLGRITFYTSKTEAGKADIYWIEKCHPMAAIGGISVEGWHITMCDIFEKKWKFDYNFMKNDEHQEMGGYALAHELGHYYYALYDEYKGSEEDDDEFYMPHSTDIAVTNSIMNKQWNAEDGNFQWLNFSVAKNDTHETAQNRAYDVSGWETLARPVSEDPQDGERKNLPDRVYYAELADVKPAENAEAKIDLPAGDARSALSISWSEGSANMRSGATESDWQFEAQLTSLLGQNISYPDPILLLAFVHKDAPVSGMNVEGSVQLPDGTSEAVLFTDDGVPPDALAGDGMYSAILGYEEEGVYTIQADFDNDDGTAAFVFSSFAPSIGIDGPVPLPDPIPISENFSLSKVVQVSVSNVIPDDHGNEPVDATALAANNVPLAGKIDYNEDKDVFQFRTLEGAVTYVRVNNLALGMNPRMRVIGADKTTVLFDVDLDSTEDAYLNIPLFGYRNTELFVELSDTSSTASGGLYEVSAGQRLASDSGKSQLLLPLVIGQ